jgi:hypothetical protein
MTTFINDSRAHLNKNNIEINEGQYLPKIKITPLKPEIINIDIKKRKIKKLEKKKRRWRLFKRKKPV